jgi:DNA-binding response OmpR family regulator
MKPLILLIEDDRAFCAAVRPLLELEGWAVVSANAVYRALVELGAGLNPDLVLLDLVLPDVRDLPAVLALHAATRAPVVAMTALPPSAVPHDLPVEAVLYKPFGVEALRRFLPRKTAALQQLAPPAARVHARAH